MCYGCKSSSSEPALTKIRRLSETCNLTNTKIECVCVNTCFDMYDVITITTV